MKIPYERNSPHLMDTAENTEAAPQQIDGGFTFQGEHQDVVIKVSKARRITYSLEAILNKAFGQAAGTEEVFWDFSLVPGPPDGQIVALVFASVASPVMGEAIQGQFPVPNPAHVSQESLEQNVRGLVHGILEARTKALTDIAQSSQEPWRPGQYDSGIVIPEFGRG